MSNFEPNPYEAVTTEESYSGPGNVPDSGRVRPTAVTVFGVLNLVFGALAICGVLSVGVVLAMLSTNAMEDAPGMDSPLYLPMMGFSGVLSVVQMILLFSSGALLLQSKALGRKLSIVYDVIAILGAVIGVIFQLAIFLPLLSAGNLNGPEAGGVIGGLVGGVIGGIIGLAYPILNWFFLTRENVTAYFQNVDKHG